MATVTFILGLAGSGKTWLKDQMDVPIKFDEGFLANTGDHDRLFAALNQGQDCVVVEIAYCFAEQRDNILDELQQTASHAKISWICIENDLEKANNNCRLRDNKPDDPGGYGHMKINNRASLLYTYPDGAKIIEMHILD